LLERARINGHKPIQPEWIYTAGLNAYPKGIAVSDEEMDAINITRDDFHGEWNYTIRPGNRSDRAVDSGQVLRR
jgi:hypothetical protein